MKVVSLLSVFAFLTFRAVGSQFVDLSYSFDPDTAIGWADNKAFEMVVTQNGTTEYGVWMQGEEIATGTHVGTHMDAPCHFAKGRWTIDRIPLDRFFAPAAVVDIRHKVGVDSDALLLVEDLRQWEWTTGRTLDHTILLLRTGWSSRWPDREAYMGNANNDFDNLHFPGVSLEAAKWLVQNRRIYGLGVESMSLDSGRNIGRRTLPAHKILLGNNIYSLENVASLEKLPSVGAMLCVLPMKIKDACGGPVRIVALLPNFA